MARSFVIAALAASGEVACNQWLFNLKIWMQTPQGQRILLKEMLRPQRLSACSIRESLACGPSNASSMGLNQFFLSFFGRHVTLLQGGASAAIAGLVAGLIATPFERYMIEQGSHRDLHSHAPSLSPVRILKNIHLKQGSIWTGACANMGRNALFMTFFLYAIREVKVFLINQGASPLSSHRLGYSRPLSRLNSDGIRPGYDCIATKN